MTSRFLPVVALLGAVAQATAQAGERPVPGARALIERGAYLVRIGACADCHTPMKMGPSGPQPDLSRGLSGHPQGMELPPAPQAQGPWLWGGAGTNTAFWGPWGVSYAVNLTPDRATGIGGWREADFVKAMRTGRHLGTGRPILPPMPWAALAQMTDRDLKAVFAYLKAQPAITNRVPEAQLAPAPAAR